jgi:hypothetical protein
MLVKPRKMAQIFADRITNMGIQAMAFYVISHERSGTHFLINSLNRNLLLRVGWGMGRGAGRGWNNIGEWFGLYHDNARRFDHIQHYKQKL